MPRITVNDGITPVTYEVVDGTTLQSFMEEQNPERKNWAHPTIALYNGAPVLRDQWATTELHGDKVVVFKRIPEGGGGGGGSNPFKIIMGVILTIVAIVLIAFQQYYIGVPMLTSGLGLLVGEVVNAIWGQKTPSLPNQNAQNAEAASPTYSINANSNQARIFQPELTVFGKLKVIPDLVAYPWSRYANNDMYLYQVFALGRGRYDIHAMSFGDVIFWQDGHLIDSAYVGDDEEYNVYSGVILSAGTWSEPIYPAPLTASIRRMKITIEMPDGGCSYQFHAAGWAYSDGYTDEYGNYHAGSKYWARGYWTPIEKAFSVTVQIREITPKGDVLSDWVNFASGSATFSSEAYSYEVRIDKNHSETRYTKFEFEGMAPSGYGVYQIRALNTSAYTGTLIGQDKPSDKSGYVNVYKDAHKRMKIGNIQTFGASVQVEIVEPHGYVSLFPDNVETSPGVAGQELIATNKEGHDWIGPFPVCPPGSTTNKILLDFTFPQGLGYYGDDGGMYNATTSWVVEYQEIDDANGQLGGWATLLSESKTNATQTAQRFTYEIDVPEKRYWVRAIRTNGTNTNGRMFDLIQWNALRAMLPGKLTYPQTIVAICIKANNRLSQNSSERFAVFQTRRLPIYDRVSKTWSEEQPTRSFAAAVCSVAKDDLGGRMQDSGLDLDGLWALDEKVTALGWSFDAAIDAPYSVWSLIVEICAAVRVVPRPVGTKLTFVMDEANRPVRHVFTPYNILRNTFQVTWLTFQEGTPDDVIVTYLDEDGGYQKRDVRAILPDSESREPAQRQPIGIVKRAQAHAYGVHLSAGNRFRRVLIEFQTEAVGRIINVGDIISVSHPRVRGVASGKLVDWNAATLVLRLDPAPETPEGDIYLSLNDPAGVPWGPVKLLSLNGDLAKFDPDDYATLITQGFSSPFEWMSKGLSRAVPTVWTLQTGREFSGRYIIKSISPVDMYKYTITAMNDDPRVYSQDIPVPPWEYRTNTNVPKELAAPEALSVITQGAGEDRKLRVNWLPVPGAEAYSVEYSTNGLDYVSLGRSNINFAVIEPSAFGQTWVRVNAVNDSDTSTWTVWEGDTSILSPATPVVEASTYTGGNVNLTWDAVDAAAGYVIQVFLPDNLTTPIRIAETTGLIWSYTLGMGMQDGGPYRDLVVSVAAVNMMGSSDPAEVILSDPAPAEILVENIQGEPDVNTLTLIDAGEVEDDVTGFVISRGLFDNFTANETIEIRSATALPYTWTGLAPETPYYFRIAAKDSFFDVTQRYDSLNYSESFEIYTLAEDTGGAE
jgi:sulfur carrier protein ThiS